MSQTRNEEECVHVDREDNVHETNMVPPGDGNEGPLQLESEEEEENPKEKVYDSDGAEVNVELTTRGCTYKGFKDCDPPNFDRKKDYANTFEWIERMNGVISISECRDDQAIKFVAHSFTNEALSWWRTIQRSKSPYALKRMTWEDLKVLMIKKFYPQNEIDRVENEFLNFSAGNLTHRQYTSRVLVHVKANLPSTFESVLNLTGIVYDDCANEDPAPEAPKRKWENPSMGIVKGSYTAEARKPRTEKYDVCRNASKSFISTSFSRKLDFTVSNIVRAFSEETDVGRNSVVFQMIEDCMIEIEGHKFPSGLFLLTLGGFDIVLGMDWLAANEAQIVCKRKMIHLKATDGSLITIYGDWNCTMSNVISMIKAESYMRRRCEAYLAYVIDDITKTKELKDVPVVCNFPEEFQEDLPGVPPDQEIEFQIDLLPGAQPVAKAP
ncbi:hypothetical protein L1987_21337 [Smallanthus sonchifolius]|uniref:Uncharacterized protein n=1 Tax=Smallanthus sonchifolius TaxID=185202 RepID=A0ACB9IUU9_9ASTR|nr:hypothetical protein L1987_21337 [Smallanthus sonchifolius]